MNVDALSKDEVYRKLIAQQASMVVAERAMTWAVLRPSAEVYDFKQADELLAFAEEHSMQLRGHCLCWHRELPAWLLQTATRENARALLAQHIKQVAGRYAGRVHSWDVVNETVQLSDGRADGLRRSIWLELIGDDYIEAAFHAAREADPQALLTYNEYGLEGEDAESHSKRVAVLLLLRRLKARGVPLDALGVQSHLNAGNHYGPGLMTFLATVRELKLAVFITEMDVNTSNLPADVATRDREAARTYADYVRMLLREPAVRVVMTWGITDRYTTVHARPDGVPERCLPFDRECHPTNAFFSLRTTFDGG